MAMSSLFSYILTFLSAMAILIMGIAMWGYYSQAEPREFLSENTIIMLNDNFIYIVAISFIIAFGEWTYKRPKKRKYDDDKYDWSDQGPPI